MTKLKEILPFNSLLLIVVAVVAFAVSFFITPLMKRIAIKKNVVDIPDGKRKLQSSPVPYLGGVAIALSFLLSTIPLWFSNNGIPKIYVIVVIGFVLTAVVGLIDDIKELKPVIKFICQIVISTLTVVFGGAIEHVQFFGHYIKLGIFAIPITVLWITLIINAVNMIDGLDGLASGTSTFSLITMIVAAFILGDGLSLVISVALCFAIVGFLPYNFPPAKIFLGDCGALSIGYVMGCLSVYGLFKGPALISVIVPALILGLPVSDAVELFFARLLKGKHPFSADRQHIHFMMIDSGFSVKQSMLILYAITIAFCIAAIVYIWDKAIAIVIAAVAFGIYALLKMLPKKFKK